MTDDPNLMTPPTPPVGLSTGRTLLFAVTGGAAVANLYWAQPLLQTIAADLSVPTAAAGLLVTTTQIGYALGVFALVPLGDVLDRRRLIPALMLASAIALLACALAPGYYPLLMATGLLGLTTVAGQLLNPLAGDLAAPGRRGRVIATVTAGLLIGILVSRTVAGAVAATLGWRAIYAIAAALTTVLALVMATTLPRLPRRAPVPYLRLLGSVVQLVRREPVVRWTLALGALGFGSFTMFWTALTPFLAGPQYGYNVATIGLFGLVGLAGALAAQRAGHLHDRGWSLPATGIAWALTLDTWALAWALGGSLAGLLVAVVVLDIAIQGQNLLNGTRLLTLSAAHRSRLNTAFVTGNFLGGATGSALAALLWGVGGWSAVCAAGTALAVLAVAIWALGTRGPLRATHLTFEDEPRGT